VRVSTPTTESRRRVASTTRSKRSTATPHASSGADPGATQQAPSRPGADSAGAARRPRLPPGEGAGPSAGRRHAAKTLIDLRPNPVTGNVTRSSGHEQRVVPCVQVAHRSGDRQDDRVLLQRPPSSGPAYGCGSAGERGAGGREEDEVIQVGAGQAQRPASSIRSRSPVPPQSAHVQSPTGWVTTIPGERPA
jgi:hypothetical protein